MENFNLYAAVFIARLFLGTLFFLQGYDKVFNSGISKIIPVYRQQLANSGLPGPVIIAAAYYTSWAELSGGLLLISGLFTDIALYALGIDLVMVAAAMGLIQPLWRMDYVFPRLALLLFLLVMPPHMNYFSLDHLFNFNLR